MRTLVASGGGDPRIMIEELDKLRGDAEQYRANGELTEELERRYTRLLKVTQLMVSPDPDGSKRAASVAEIEAFVADVEGEQRSVDPQGGLAEVGPALADEVLNLYMLLDGTTDREKARDKYLPGLGD
jgi:hypothetical protein